MERFTHYIIRGLFKWSWLERVINECVPWGQIYHSGGEYFVETMERRASVGGEFHCSPCRMEWPDL